jgi:hypothetical protein
MIDVVKKISATRFQFCLVALIIITDAYLSIDMHFVGARDRGGKHLRKWGLDILLWTDKCLSLTFFLSSSTSAFLYLMMKA